MKTILALLVTLLLLGLAYAVERNCTLMQDATAYYDSGNYHNTYYLRNSSLSAWSSRKARDVLEWRAKLIPSGTSVDVVERQGDAVVIKVGSNTYYVSPDDVDCP